MQTLSRMTEPKYGEHAAVPFVVSTTMRSAIASLDMESASPKSAYSIRRSAIRWSVPLRTTPPALDWIVGLLIPGAP